MSFAAPPTPASDPHSGPAERARAAAPSDPLDPGLLERVEERLRAAVAADGLMGLASAHLLQAPAAKRARPRLFLAFAALAGDARAARPRADEALVAAAAALELIHTASLLHDDVVDEAGARRGAPSANARYGNSAAVLAGDLVLTRALGLLSFDAAALAAAIDVVGAMSVAAVREVEVRGVSALAPEAALAVAEGKTAALFGLCGRLAGILGHDDDAGRRFEEAGRALGVAFQIADDAADIETDLRERTPSHPILLAQAHDPDVAEALRALWSPPGVDAASARALASRIGGGAAVAGSLEVVAREIEVAARALAPWAGSLPHEHIFRFAATLSRRPA
jgi:heptaprenyl diphosphate synthase